MKPFSSKHSTFADNIFGRFFKGDFALVIFYLLVNFIIFLKLAFSFRWLQSLTMEVILSTAFGVKAETQTVENDPITEMAKKATSPKPIVGLCKGLLLSL